MSTATFIIAAVVYAVIASYMSVQSAAALSILLIMGALIINSNNGKNFLSEIGV